MADLLECLIQIKALRETLDLVTGPISPERSADAGRVTASETGDVTLATWQRLAEAEQRYATALGTDDASPPRAAPASGAAAMEVFLALRRANLGLLGSCTASRLAAPVAWAGRPATTVADLVAIMLASDTERLAGYRQAVRAARIPDAGPA